MGVVVYSSGAPQAARRAGVRSGISIRRPARSWRTLGLGRSGWIMDVDGAKTAQLRGAGVGVDTGVGVGGVSVFLFTYLINEMRMINNK
jgi:hypothetical protein